MHLVRESDSETYLLSRDMDFSDKSGVLYPDLAEDLGDAAEHFHPVKELNDLLIDHLADTLSRYDQLRLAAAEAALAEAEEYTEDWPPMEEPTLSQLVHDAVLAAAEHLVGFEVEIDPSMGSSANSSFSSLELPSGPDSYDVGSCRTTSRRSTFRSMTTWKQTRCSAKPGLTSRSSFTPTFPRATTTS